MDVFRTPGKAEKLGMDVLEDTGENREARHGPS